MTNEFILNEYKARQHWDRRDYSAALSCAKQAADLALMNEDEAAWWRMTLLLAECQRELGLIDECAETASTLARHRIAERDSILEAKARALQSVALQGMGQLPEALAVARAAVDTPSGDEHGVNPKLDAQLVLIAVLAESGRLDDAWREAQKLAGLIDDDIRLEQAGKAYWSIGNVAFLMGRNSEATHYHGLAAESLSPSNDLSLWALFNKASAFMRLTANLVEPETLQCIERAEMALSIAGGTPQDELDVAMIRAYWIYLTGEAAEARQRMAALLAKSDSMAPHSAGEALLLYARIVADEGDLAEAAKHGLASARLFESAGATDRAEQARAFFEGNQGQSTGQILGAGSQLATGNRPELKS
ncbi:hypothetical protein [Arthrobacter luteolus]|uniref:hypothetical protein n=1 Tax=Arthrobacter luteolus TaxID=98672 RepID=UPI00385097DE